MNEAILVREALRDLVCSSVEQIHREEYFTTMLIASLWPILGKRLLGTTGLGLEPLLEYIRDGEADRIRIDHLPDGCDLYADLLITAPQNQIRLESTVGIDHVVRQISITHIYEFKYLTSFPTMERKHAREDSYKLKIIGEYLMLSTGIRPYMEQFIVMSKRASKRTHTIQSLRNWFIDNRYRSEVEGVIVSIVDTDGVIHSAI